MEQPETIVAGASVTDREEKHGTKVFISYSRKDMAFADRLEEALKARGFEPLIDRTEIYVFEDWWARIQTLILRADTVVFVLSPDSAASKVALQEVSFAASANKRFAPIVRHSVNDGAVPEALAKLHFLFFDDDARFDESVNRLVEALNTDIYWIRQHTDLSEQARRWAATGRPAGLLLRSPVLEQSEYWLAAKPKHAPEPTEQTRAYIHESRRAAIRQRVRARRVQGLIYSLFVAIIAGLIAWINQAFIAEQMNWYLIARPYRVANIDPFVLRPAAERTLKPLASFRECAAHCPEMIVIPAGEFMMGSPMDEPGRSRSEGPQHLVKIALPFAVSKFEVTFDEWETCVTLGGCPRVSDSSWGRGSRPAINLTWYEAQRYVGWLSKMTGRKYRLLSEAEWEYAARAGTSTPFSFVEGETGIDRYAWYSANAGNKSQPVGKKSPNAFGLHDVHGNVLEWVQDCAPPTYERAPADGSPWEIENCDRRVIRGGSWYLDPKFLRSASRSWDTSDGRNDSVGFRVARSLGP